MLLGQVRAQLRQRERREIFSLALSLSLLPFLPIFNLKLWTTPLGARPNWLAFLGFSLTDSLTEYTFAFILRSLPLPPSTRANRWPSEAVACHTSDLVRVPNRKWAFSPLQGGSFKHTDLYIHTPRRHSPLLPITTFQTLERKTETKREEEQEQEDGKEE